jgi:hypothetical protein
MSTPEIIGPVIYCQTPAELATLAVAPFLSGQHARVKAMRASAGPGEYVLQDAISTAPDGFFVVQTADDSNRQWVAAGIAEQAAFGFVSVEFDLTQAQTVTLLRPLNYKPLVVSGVGIFATQKDGTVTTGPTTQCGNDVGISNFASSTIQSTLASSTAGTRTALQGSSNGTSIIDLSTGALKLQITSGAVLGSATVFRGRAYLSAVLYR